MTFRHLLRSLFHISPERAVSNLRADITRHAKKVLETGDNYAGRRIFAKLAEIDDLEQVRKREFEAQIEELMA